MAQARPEMTLPRKNPPKGSRQDRLRPPNNPRAHSRTGTTHHSQTFCKSLLRKRFLIPIVLCPVPAIGLSEASPRFRLRSIGRRGGKT